MKILICFAALAVGLGTDPVAAQSPEEGLRTHAVRIADLDLGSPAGVAALDRRLRVAVSTVCGSASDADLEGRNEVRRCRTATRESLSAKRNAVIAGAAQGSPIVLTSRQ